MTGTVSTRGPGTTTRTGTGPIRTTTIVGGLVWLVGVAQYFVAQLVVASAWHPPYSWTGNYISDLGNTVCGPFAVPHGTAMYVCSPRHGVMNTSFVVSGVLFVLGAVLLRRMWPSGTSTHRAFLLLVVAGVGKAIVGLAPENVNVGLHLLGSLNVPLVSVAILMLSASTRTTNPVLSVTGYALAAIGLAGTVLSTLGQFAGATFYFGLGVGGMERIASYPGTIWVALIALAALARTGADA